MYLGYMSQTERDSAPSGMGARLAILYFMNDCVVCCVLEIVTGHRQGHGEP